MIRWSWLKLIRRALAKNSPRERRSGDDGDPIYWDKKFADVLETWGKDHVWLEIQAFLAGRRGRVLDIACGSGGALVGLQTLQSFHLYGCDFSDYLISRAAAKLSHAKGYSKTVHRRESPQGLIDGRETPSVHLVVCNALRLPFVDKSFDYSYSLGSLEHFAEGNIQRVLTETCRVTRICSFHQVPIALGGDEGWISPYQSYYNNSQEWWIPKFKSVFREVYTLPSGWFDERSSGKWFVCVA